MRIFSALLFLIALNLAGSGPESTIWSIGKPDGLPDEFASGAAKELIYDIGHSDPAKDWREQQQAGEPAGGPVYRIRFTLDRLPESPVFAIDCYFLRELPLAFEINVNGQRGYSRVVPGYAKDLDNRQSTEITFTRQSLRAPIPPSALKKGANEIAISLIGPGGVLYYDWVALLDSTRAFASSSAGVEPTMFFKRTGGVLKELTDIVVRHQKPIGQVAIKLKIGGEEIGRNERGDGYDFGEQVVELEAPALDRPAGYALEAAIDGKRLDSRGEFRPEKRWRVFATLRIHNDIGFTDLQSNLREQDARNVDQAVDLVSRFPFYKFNFEDSWLVDNYARLRKPEPFQQLMRLAAQNRLGVGGIYLNLLTGLCTGEELYRALYYAKGLEKKYGVPVTAASISDVASTTWFIPSLLADAGIKGFTNGSNQTRGPLLANSRLGEDSPFYWEGADRSRVIAWFTRNYRHFDRLAGMDPTPEKLRRTLPQFLARYRRADYPVDAVIMYGLFGDNAQLRGGDAASIGRYAEVYEFPKLIAATDADFFNYIKENFDSRLPVHRGDAGAYWEDGAASSAAETRTNRDTQRMIPVAEMAAALATVFQPSLLYPAEEFREAWRKVLFYDEHTWGSSRAIPQPDRRAVQAQWDAKRAFSVGARTAGKDLLERSLARLAQTITLGGSSVLVFNADSRVRTGTVEVELDQNQRIVNPATGTPVPLETTLRKPGYRSVRFIARDVPAFGYRAYGVQGVGAQASSSDQPETPSTSWTAESRYYRVEIDPATGAIAQIRDKELGRDLVDTAAPYKLNQLLYVLGGDDSQLVRYYAYSKPAVLGISGQQRGELIENVKTPLGSRIRVRARANSVPAIESEIVLYDDLKRIDIVNRFSKEEQRAKEAVYFAFPFAASSPEFAYDIQNAWVRPNTDQLPGACREWFAIQNAVLVRDRNAAIAWSSPDAPLVTLTDINRGLWLKDLPIRNGHVFSYVMNNYWFTNYRASQSGELTVRYFITSGTSMDDAASSRFSRDTRSPLVAYDYFDRGFARVAATGRPMPANAGSFFKLEGCSAEVSTLKEAEDGDGLILRVRETANRQATCRLESPVFRVHSAATANGVEANQGQLAVRDNGVEFPLGASKYATLRLRLSSAQ